MNFYSDSTYWSTLHNIAMMSNDIIYNEIYKIYSETEDVQVPYNKVQEPIECDPILPTEPVTRSRNVGKESRKRRAKPSGQDKRWSPPEKIKTTKGSPADQKAKKIAMDIKRQRKWHEPFLAEPICHDLVIHNKKKTEWIPPAKVRVRHPIYDKPCGGVVANYCNSKWPTCPNQGITTYIAPRWPVN